ncbi:hypothetical protein LguiA_023962 [Lonicera macranthoides]
MSTKIPASFESLQCTVLPHSNGLKLKSLVGTCAHESAFPNAFPRLCFCSVSQPLSISISKGMDWSIRSSVNSNSGLSPPEDSQSGNGRVRLVSVIKGLQVKAVARIQGIRKGFPMKLMLFLVGFYSATAFATVIGQTGDWDVLSAGLAVIVVEGIGALMYKNSLPLVNKIKGLITMFNYWKAGLSLGLFLDAFKYEIDNNNILGLPNPFTFEFDLFSMFL